jgi:hypothetical protein
VRLAICGICLAAFGGPAAIALQATPVQNATSADLELGPDRSIRCPATGTMWTMPDDATIIAREPASIRLEASGTTFAATAGPVTRSHDIASDLVDELRLLAPDLAGQGELVARTRITGSPAEGLRVTAELVAGESIRFRLASFMAERNQARCSILALARAPFHERDVVASLDGIVDLRGIDTTRPEPAGRDRWVDQAIVQVLRLFGH